MRISDDHTLTIIPGLRLENPISCIQTSGNKMLDFCLELSKIKVLKMLDLQTKSAIDLTDPLVLI